MNKGFQQGITLRHLRALVALSDLKLIARVSEALGVTQPAVSKQIAELEKIVGVPVVTRDRNRLYLTPIGIRLADHARQALGQLDRAAFDIEAMTSGVSGSVSVGVVSSVAPVLLPRTIALFKRSTPQANVSVFEGHFVELLPQLETSKLDLLIARIWQPQDTTLPTSGRLFPHLSVDRVVKRYALLRRRHPELSGTVFHSTRKWFITQCERTGVPEHFTASLVGHHSARSANKLTYGLYSAGISDAQKREIVEGVRVPAELAL